MDFPLSFERVIEWFIASAVVSCSTKLARWAAKMAPRAYRFLSARLGSLDIRLGWPKPALIPYIIAAPFYLAWAILLVRPFNSWDAAIAVLAIFALAIMSVHLQIVVSSK